MKVPDYARYEYVNNSTFPATKQVQAHDFSRKIIEKNGTLTLK